MRISTYACVFMFWAFFVNASDPKTLVIYHDADYTQNFSSANAMKMGMLTALDEVDNKIQGFNIELVEKNHRGNIKRSLATMKQFLNDENALFVLGGLHSPPYIKNRGFIVQNGIPLLVPWAAGGPITRFPSEDNSVFRLSIDDTKAGIRMSKFALNQLACKAPHLLLENTPWGKSNQVTISGYLKDKVPYKISWFDWGTKQNVARIMLRNIQAEKHDCIFLVANFSESSQFINAMLSMETSKRLPIISHWGVTGGDVDTIFNEQTREKISFNFIQSCYSLSSAEQSPFQQNVLVNAKQLFPQFMSDPKMIKSPAGFIHAYDLGRIAISALKQITLTGDMQQDRKQLKTALENLNQPVQGLIKTYEKPFSSWSDSDTDAHEALGLDNFCMAKFGKYNSIEVNANHSL